jgi:hypothetical protein
MVGPDCDKEETLCFENDDTSPTYAIPHTIDSTRNLIKYTDASLGDFLKRPVKVSSQTWTTAAGFTLATVDPWTLFYTNAAVAQKIKNYYLLRSKLKVKIVLVGGPFYYGRMLVDYLPLWSTDTINQNRNTVPQDAIAASQRPHLYLDPCTSSGGIIDCPFLYPTDYMTALTVNADWSKMGILTFRALAALKHANGATGVITINTYVWAEDVELLIPTSQSGIIFDDQSGSEYGKGILSKPLTAAAAVAGRMGEVVSFRPYARATQQILTGLGQWASLLGFSRPQILTDLGPVRMFPAGHMAVCDRPEMIQKTSMDSKQELSIDPRVVGLGPEDELSIVSIAQRESYLTQFTWTVAAAADTLLFSIPVSPCQSDTNGVAPEIHMVPMNFVSLPFTFWRGTLNFRFIIVSSSHHKGKLRISFDPYLQSVVPTNVNYNRVIDISTTKDFTIPVSWCQEQAFKLVDTSFGPQWSTSPLTVHSALWNGMLSVYVANELGVPNSVANNDITVLVCVSAGPDFEVAAPNSVALRSLSLFTNQSEPTIDPGATAQMDDGMPLGTNMLSPVGDLNPIGSLYDVYFGEKVSNLRYLMKRYSIWLNIVPSIRTTATLFNWSVWFPSFPLPYGYDPVGFSTTTGPKLKKYSPVNSSYLAYFAPAFLMRRGGTRWKFCGTGMQDNTSDIYAYRKTPPSIAAVYGLNNNGSAGQNSVTNTFESIAVLANQFPPMGVEGIAADDYITGVEFEVPYYNNERFTRARCMNFNQSSVMNLTGWDMRYYPVTGQMVQMMTCAVAAAEDFSLHFFTSVPIMFQYNVSDTY